MTLGPKFFSCNKMTITRRTKHLRKMLELPQKALNVYYAVALSKHDLKPSGTFFWKFACDLGFAGYVFSSNVAPGGRLRHEAYNGCCTRATLKIKRTDRHMRSISKYMIVNSFCPFSNVLISIFWMNSQWIFPFANDCINYLIGHSMDLAFS